MKRAFVLFAALCMVLPIAAPQTAAPKPGVHERPASADEAAIRQVSEDWIRFYNAADALLHWGPRLLCGHLPGDQRRSDSGWAHSNSAEESERQVADGRA